MTEKHLTDQKFTDLNLVDTLKKGVVDAGFEFCTPIQASSLPVALQGKDVAGQAQTGTGKTIAFLLACCNHLIINPPPAEKQDAQVRALILAPTRELAIQIYRDAEVLAKHTELKLGLVYGGTGYEDQKIMLAEGIDILIGTPGRLIDFYKQNLYGLKYAQTLVIDEADRMFDLGFIKDIRYLLRQMPKPEDRLNLLYSATLSFRVMELAYEHMNNPEEIKIDAETRIADKIEEYCFYPADEEKPVLLVNLLQKNKSERALVFVNTRHAVERVAKTLSANDISNAALSGDVPQRKRESLLEGFKSGKYRVLVATDVAARGLHIPEVSHVFNYDLPQDAEDYVHRIGRTARAGKSGEAVSFLCEKYAYSIMEIETFIGHNIPKNQIDPWMLEPVIVAARVSDRDRDNRKRRKPGSQGRSDKKQVARKKSTRQVSESRDSGTIQTDLTAVDQRPEIATTDLPESMTNFDPSELLQNAPVAESVDVDVDVDSAILPEPVDSSDQKEIPVTTPPPVINRGPYSGPDNRFSRKFGEIPLVG